MQGLRVVAADEEPGLRRELLVVSVEGHRKKITVEEGDVHVPLIDIGLCDYFTPTQPVDTRHPIYGVTLAALLPYIAGGERRFLRGAIVTLLRDVSVVVPFGFFRGRLN